MLSNTENIALRSVLIFSYLYYAPKSINIWAEILNWRDIRDTL